MSNSIYLIICGTREPYVAERDLKDMGREATIRDLAAGEWGDIDSNRFRASSVIEVGTEADRTQEFIDAARMLKGSYRTPYSREEAAQWQADRARSLVMSE